jgi:hypothetical protein
MKRFLTLAALACSVPTLAAEGMWLPHQLPALKTELKRAGLQVPPKKFSELTSHPMGAVVSLGGCSASFVSEIGLVVTNHHCVLGSLQYNTTENLNLLEDGFMADSFADELPAAPGSRIWVTVAATDVTQEVTGDLDPEAGGAERYEAIELEEKQLIAKCEEDPGHRCKVRSFLGGISYYLFKQLEVRDVRLVYSPPASIGVFGGDIDNWMWPRHTGDYSFLRAYVGPDGRSADYSEDNVPYRPRHHLRIGSGDLDDGDLVMVVGYPGRTARYRLAAEVENAFEWYYPARRALLERTLERIDEKIEVYPEVKIQYASTLAGLNNSTKNYGGMIDGFAASGMLERKRKLEKELQAWILSDDALREQHESSLRDLEALVLREQSTRERDLILSRMGRASMLSTARQLYRLSRESRKPDAERKPGYQERDRTSRRQRFERLDRRYHAEVDKAVWRLYIGLYEELPADQRIEAFDAFFKLGDPTASLDGQLDAMYRETRLDELDVRLSLMQATPEELEASDDPFIQLAVALYEGDVEREKEKEAIAGEFQLLRPRYMQTLVAFLEAHDRPVYSDANGTLRITYGKVTGFSPQDGLYYLPFTRVEGILEKFTGTEPFDSPQAQLDAIAAKSYGDLRLESINSVPVNFLSTVDTTGGNSGSPTLNGRGELVGLLFDGTYESINADWDFNERTSRAIHVDARYMLWVMRNVDGARRVLEELGQM